MTIKCNSCGNGISGENYPMWYGDGSIFANFCSAECRYITASAMIRELEKTGRKKPKKEARNAKPKISTRNNPRSKKTTRS